jgi:hypothetical protein
MIWRRLRPFLRRLKGKRVWRIEGRSGVRRVGHRAYIGGRWDEYGKLEFNFMVGQGLRPDHVLLDIACGSLRAGIHFIPYLEPGNYLGIEKEEALIERGLETELPAQVRAERRPELVVSETFEFERLSKQADYALAWSLFTHLVADDLETCLRKLRAYVAPEHQFYATFLPGASEQNALHSHAHAAFYYPPEEIIAMGERSGWQCEYLGRLEHTRVMKQRMMRFTPARLQAGAQQ